MHPSLLGFSSYWVSWALGIAAGLAYDRRALARSHIPFGRTVLALAIAAPFAWVGAKAEFCFENGIPLISLGSAVGHRLPGALIGLLIALPLALVAFRLPVLAVLDCLAPGVALTLSVGRIGCFLNGCCFGTPTRLPWGVRFPVGSRTYWNEMADGLLPVGASASLSVHPLQLYFAAADFAIFAFLARRRGHPGQMLLEFLALHSFIKASLEPLRGREYASAVNRAGGVDLAVAALATALIVGLYVVPNARRAATMRSASTT